MIAAQSTPQTYRSRAGVRRQSSVGPLNDTSPLTGAGAVAPAAEPHISTPAHSATIPVSSLSTNPSSYYTNASPSPPAAPVHYSCDDILAPATTAPARTPSSRSAPHSAVNLHQAGRPTALAFVTERAQTATQVGFYLVTSKLTSKNSLQTNLVIFPIHRIRDHLNTRMWGQRLRQLQWRWCLRAWTSWVVVWRRWRPGWRPTCAEYCTCCRVPTAPSRDIRPRSHCRKRLFLCHKRMMYVPVFWST